MYSLRTRPSVRCNATTRGEKHSNIRKKANASRKTQNEKLRSSLGVIAKDERSRITTIIDAHKEFFASEPKESEKKTIDAEIVVDNEDLDSANGFFETD
jgi:hypothetical protein